MRPRALMFIGIALALGWGAFRLWLILGGVVPPAPAFSDVRAGYRASDLLLLDRRGEVIQEVRTDPRRRRLGWTPLDEISPRLRSAVLASRTGASSRTAVSTGAPSSRRAFSASRGPSSRCQHHHHAARHAAGPRPAPPRRSPGTPSKDAPSEVAADAARVADRGRVEQARDPRGLSEHGELPRRARGRGGGLERAVRRGAHGIGAAEGAVLAVLLRAPNAGLEAVARRAWALVESQRDGPARDVVRAAAAQALESPAGTGPRVALAPHAAARLLGPGAAARASSPVRTTLDGALQRMAAESLRRHLLAVRAEHVQDGAVLVVDNASGEVLAYVGGSGDLGSARHVDGIRARRQAGSTLKPFLYAEALDRRLLTAASLLEDTPLDLAVAGGLYRPRNYDEGFKGLVSVRTALASSLNVPAVRALDLVGEEAAVELLRRLGFDGLARVGRLLRSVDGARLGRREPLGARQCLPGARARRDVEPAPPRRRRGRGRLGAASIPIARRSSSRASSPTARAEASRSASRTRSPRASGPRSRPAPARRCATTGASATRAATRWVCGWATSGASPCET
jgi:penicillin-binding protein 1C